MYTEGQMVIVSNPSGRRSQHFKGLRASRESKYHEDDFAESDVERIKLNVRQLAAAIATIPSGDHPPLVETFIARTAFTMTTGIPSGEASTDLIVMLASYAETSLAYELGGGL